MPTPSPSHSIFVLDSLNVSPHLLLSHLSYTHPFLCSSDIYLLFSSSPENLYSQTSPPCCPSKTLEDIQNMTQKNALRSCLGSSSLQSFYSYSLYIQIICQYPSSCLSSPCPSSYHFPPKHPILSSMCTTIPSSFPIIVTNQLGCSHESLYVTTMSFPGPFTTFPCSRISFSGSFFSFSIYYFYPYYPLNAS